MSTILFDRVLARGGVWHLWGHPWELDELNLWDQLAQVLDHVAHREGVLYLNNNQLVRYLSPGQ
ncbi:MAG: hypothetical protein H0X25_24030 [Acidobacteriales bacterium]|nr:hypothetical protein [Terriglobales bacterium]